MGQSVLRAFLFTDLVGSTAQWDTDPDSMSVALARHEALASVVTSQPELLKEELARWS